MSENYHPGIPVFPGEHGDGLYVTKRRRPMPYPERPEGTRIIFYNLHLPGKDGKPGTPVGVVAFLFSENFARTARGIAIRSLMDEWDPGEGRIRAAGRAIRAYKKYYHIGGQDAGVAATFGHHHAVKAVRHLGFDGAKYLAPALPTPREYRLLEKKYGDQVRAAELRESV